MSSRQPSMNRATAQASTRGEELTFSLQPVAHKRLFRRSSFYVWGSVLLALLLILGGLTVFLKFQRSQAAPVQSTIVGHAFFVNSGQVSSDSSAGIADQLQISLQNIQPPAAGKNYYAWLLSDNTAQALPILLGSLPVQNGTVKFSYPGDSHHTDILANYSRFLVTEEDASTPPVNYTLDKSAWIFGAAFSEVPNAADTVNHYSLFDHLRHLLAQDPKLKDAGLTGGLDIWLFRDTEKLLEWAGSARNSNDPNLMQRQLVRILDYLDGEQFVRTERLPAGLAPIEVDQTIARVALLEIDPSQNPPGYLKHIGTHLREITQSPGVDRDQKALAIRITQAINNVQFWLEAAHKDAEMLLQMSRAQLLQPAATKIFNDLFTQVNDAFIGQTDPNTLQVKEGVAQIHYNIQRLATFMIQACTARGATCG